MLIIGLQAIELRTHSAARGPMARWVRLTEEAAWHSIIDIRKTFPSADAIKGTNLTCFNIAGNRYRLRTTIAYARQEITIVEVGTHAEYDKR